MSQVCAEVGSEAPLSSRGTTSRWAGPLKRLAPFALLAGLPFLLLAADPNWIYSPPGGLDAWLYQGFFRSLPHYQATLFPGTYYGSRLSWVLPGYFAYRVFPPFVANLVLHLSVYFLAVFSFYVVAAKTVSRRAALFGAVLFGANPLALEELGSDYVSGAGIAYYLFALALLAHAAASARRYRWLVLAGAAAAALVYTNLVWLPFTPLLWAFYAFARRKQGAGPGLVRRALLESAATLAAGALLLTVVLGAANVHIRGGFLFFMPSVNMYFSLTSRVNPWLTPMSAWLSRASWLTWPVLGLLGSVLFCAGRALRGQGVLGGGVLGWWPLNCLVMSALFFAAQLRGQPVLQFNYYAVYLLPPALLAACAFLRDPLARLRPAQFVGAVVVLSAGAFLGYRLLWIPVAFPASLAVGVAGVCLASFFRRRRALVIAALGLLGLAGVFPLVDRAPILRERAAHFERLSQGVDAVHSVIGNRRPRFWYDADEPCRYDCTSLSSIWLWGFSLVNDHFPNLDADWKSPLTPGEFVVVISRREGALELAREALRRHGIELRPAGRRDVSNQRGNYSLTFAEVVSVPPSPVGK